MKTFMYCNICINEPSCTQHHKFHQISVYLQLLLPMDAHLKKSISQWMKYHNSTQTQADFRKTSFVLTIALLPTHLAATLLLENLLTVQHAMLSINRVRQSSCSNQNVSILLSHLCRLRRLREIYLRQQRQ